MSAIFIETKKAVAYDSPDHLQPYGTAQDNTTNRRFNQKLFDYIPPQEVRLLDIGCSGGGLVKSILDEGGFAVGIEGSDYSKRHRRAEWATIPDHLFTADATEPFQLSWDSEGQKEPLRFNVITAWELFEHIAEDRLPKLITNVTQHLAKGGILLASIATFDDIINGVQLHQTIHRKKWWIDFFARNGLSRARDVESYFHFDMLRGTPIGPSFTIALSKSGESPIHSHKLEQLIQRNRSSEIRRTISWLTHYKTWWHLGCYAVPALGRLRVLKRLSAH